MRAEFLKIRSMPTPMWCLIGLLICFVLGFAGVIWLGPGEDGGATGLAIEIPTAIASIIFGVWMFGVEFGQNTLRQALTADPRRGRLILVKLLVTLLCVALVTALLFLLSLPLYDLAASGHEGSIGADALAHIALAAIVLNVVYATVGFAFALIAASMAGGITLALIFLFVIDTVTSIVSWTNDYAMGPALSAITDNIRPFGTDFLGDAVTNVTAHDVIVVIAWLVVLIGLGSLRFIRSEVK
ncbi:MAG: hypothetical protein JJE13_11630 [Thermoleophilia bacterium]|nr:hypothetical protein [Thermoleophilia bacterium]